VEKIITNTYQETQDIGKNLAEGILMSKAQKGALVLCLQGDLGAGKTTFLQGFAKGLGINDMVNSPTFVIMKKFPIKNRNFKYFYHFDCYRLNSPEEMLELGFKNIISDPKNIVAIEWPEKISKLLPQNNISITFEHLEENKREISIKMQ